MSDEKQEFPSIEEILKTWISTNRAAEIMGMTRQGVFLACQRKPNDPYYLRSKLIGGRWYIDPEAANNYDSRYSS